MGYESSILRVILPFHHHHSPLAQSYAPKTQQCITNYADLQKYYCYIMHGVLILRSVDSFKVYINAAHQIEFLASPWFQTSNDWIDLSVRIGIFGGKTNFDVNNLRYELTFLILKAFPRYVFRMDCVLETGDRLRSCVWKI